MLVAGGAQVVALAVLWVVAGIAAQGLGGTLPLPAELVLQGTMAALLGWRWGLPRWWIPLQLVFVPGLYAALQLPVPSYAYLGVLVLLILALGNSVRERVPLFLTSRPTWVKLAALLPERPGVRFVDLGCGFGGGLARLTESRPDAELTGVENGPIPWLVSRIRIAPRPACHVRWRDLWAIDLAGFDVVYAFLSPEPMARLWAKARREMRPGTVFISNSFAVPDAIPETVVDVGDRRGSRLWVYRP